jgi:phage/plasmid-like protein (TIGR03299 family)
MSHEVETMAYANAVPWHGIGTKVGGDVTAEEMLEAAGLNWKVKRHRMQAQADDGTIINIPGRYALIRDRDNKVMTITGDAWKPVQNSDILAFMKQYVEAGGATLETAGALRGGKTVWALANLNHEFQAQPGDHVKGYLMMTTSHIVGISTKVATTSVRVVCANTLRAAESEADFHYTQNHLTPFNFDSAKVCIANAHESLSLAEKTSKVLVDLKLSADDALRKVFAPVFLPNVDSDDFEVVLSSNQLPKTINEILDSYHNAPGAQPGTGWGALNAVTHWADHVAGRNTSSRLNNAWFGVNAKSKLKTEKVLLQLAD